ncbi:MAG: cobalamin-binding protein [Candidatus Peregrinibacteria bacterium]|nr:cobalamin-binding protein [Candidatus Peregrinibacteria bacterium]
MRIASLSPAATEILFAIGCGSEIVCTDQFSNFPEEAKSIPKLRGHMEVKSEDLRRFSPELVLTGTAVQTGVSERLKKEGFAVIHQDPRSIEQIYEAIRIQGTLTSRSSEAESIVLTMQQGFNAVKKKAQLLPSRPRVYVEEWHQPPMASGNWVPEVVRIAGAEPFPIAAGELSREVTLDEVRAFDPALIVISWCGAGSLADRELLLKRDGWDVLTAVQEKRVRVLDDSLFNRPGPRLVEGAQRVFGWVFEMLH